MILLFANNAVSTIATPINAAATSVQLATGDSAKFPNPTVGEEFLLPDADFRLRAKLWLDSGANTLPALTPPALAPLVGG